MMMYLLGHGFRQPTLCTPKPGIAWKRTVFEYDGLRYIGSFAPLFVHQYSQAWFDFRRQARQVCRLLSELGHRHRCASPLLYRAEQQFPDYSDDLWGITASDSAKGYVSLGWPAGHGSDRWNGRARSRWRLDPVPSANLPAGTAKHSRAISASLEPGTDSSTPSIR